MLNAASRLILHTQYTYHRWLKSHTWLGLVSYVKSYVTVAAITILISITECSKSSRTLRLLHNLLSLEVW